MVLSHYIPPNSLLSGQRRDRTAGIINCKQALYVLVAVGEGAKMAGPQGPHCHRLMAAETPPVIGGYGRRLDHSRFADGLGWPWPIIFKFEKKRSGFRLV